ncbi:hypothetical protein A3B32_01305 [Candidatus Uhrbacteria bacterium RIFCSPLOWO2_01_FULL_53_9]|uniref:RCK N-terminal domain-containing protein n=2 Tax=Candidatus Uhriibacteriota TaxID=1752732 RepID=A0A1F7UYA6_9BACT|nr:MAG: hypothetical protein A3B32_01305 [Candidatus Uhrbacteria bacterium RIFCSPLOWO2_01_FULL_53_9]OGL90032.1 MAG: hypothetical protein A3I45_00520 [Candidatus Uhrbacteria bacterium RIFCSPLOWO2_02_FULL_53_10]
MEIFLEISLILIVAAFTATLAKALRQPIIPAYILAGVLLGPSVFYVIKSDQLLETLATFGIAFLLFLVGIELDVRKFMRVGKVAILAGVLQMFFAVVFGFLIIKAFGFSNTNALLLSFAMGFSSTIIGLKLIGEKKELDTLYGQLVIGMMLTQDFIAILFLLFFDVIVGIHAGGTSTLFAVGLIAAKAIGLFSLAFLSSKFALKYLFSYFAKSAELLFLGSVAWCLIVSLGAIYLGLSIEVGALLAGVSLSFLPYSHEISYRIKSLRDFFLPIFFAVLGGQLLFIASGSYIIPAVVLSALVLFGSPLLVMFFLMRMGYRARTGFQAGIAIGQISEFSFILMALAFSKGVIGHDLVAFVALIGLVTMMISAYMFEHSERLYKLIQPMLKRFEKGIKEDHLYRVSHGMRKHVILVGFNSMGRGAYRALTKAKQDVVVVDNDPSVTKNLQKEGIPNMYGSMNDDEVLDRLFIDKARAVISTVRSVPDTAELLEYAKHHAIRTKMIVTAFNIDDAKHYYDLGAHYVIVPTLMSARFVPEALGYSKKDAKRHAKTLQIFY